MINIEIIIFTECLKKKKEFYMKSGFFDLNLRFLNLRLLKLNIKPGSHL